MTTALSTDTLAMRSKIPAPGEQIERSMQTRELSRSRAIICGVAFALLLAGAIHTALAEEQSEKTLSSWVKELSDSGRMNVEFYEPGKPRDFEGWTVFEFRLEFEYECQVKWPQKKPRAGTVAVTANFTKLNVPVTHRVELPKRLEGERWYEAALGRHELEHVRVGSHPRLIMLSKHVVKKLKRIERTVAKPGEVTKEWIKKQIEDELLLRKTAIQSLVMDINRHIDNVTRHGARPLPDREQFLDDLFLKENLDAMKFAYLAEVMDLINTREYLDAKVQTREVDPVAADVPQK